MSLIFSCSGCKQPLEHKFLIKGREILSCPGCQLEQIGNLEKIKVRTLIDQFEPSYLTEYAEEKLSYSSYFDGLLSRLPKMPKNSRLFDVGCAQGFLMEEARKAGFRVEGVDASEEIVKQVRANGFKVYLSLFEDLRLPAQKFDVVTLLQTIEHMKDLSLSLKKVWKILKPGGYLLITTPDREGFLGRVMGRFWFTYHNSEHLYFFSKRSLANLLERHRFVVKKIYTEYGRQLNVGYVFSRLTNNYYNQSNWLSDLLRTTKAWLWPVRNVSFREPFVNIVAIAQKNV